MSGALGASPALVAVVAGTGTDVGKTWVACALARSLRALGLSVSARKPAQSFAPGTPPEGTDAGALGAATGESPAEVCPPHRWYPLAMAPPMAAAELGRPVPTVADLAAELAWPPGADVGLVELAGGVASPLAADGDGAALARLVAPALVVLVAAAGLGVINDVRLSTAALGAPPVPVVFLNRFDPGDRLHRLNRAWLEDRDGMDVCTSVGELAARAGAGRRRLS